MKRVVSAGWVLVAAIFLTSCGPFGGPKTLYTETFSSSGDSAWPQSETASNRKWIADGRYNILVKTNTSTWAWNNQKGPFADAQIDCDVHHIAGTSNLSAAGLVFRLVDGSNAYYFRISPAGTYHIGKWIAGAWTAIVGWTSDSAVQQGVGTNHLTVIADGNVLTFLINGTEVSQQVDAAFSSGFVGVIATSYDTVGSVQVAFDNLTVREIE